MLKLIYIKLIIHVHVHVCVCFAHCKQLLEVEMIFWIKHKYQDIIDTKVPPEVSVSGKREEPDRKNETRPKSQ